MMLLRRLSPQERGASLAFKDVKDYPKTTGVGPGDTLKRGHALLRSSTANEADNIRGGPFANAWRWILERFRPCD